MGYNYFTLEYAIEVHDELVRSSGGLLGIRELGLLESILDFIQNDLYYPELEDKLSYLLYALNKNHCFVDGNKRASINLTTYFLTINGLDILVPKFILKLENVAVDVADNVIDRDLLQEIIYSLIYEEDYSEELKLQIIHAKLSKME